MKLLSMALAAIALTCTSALADVTGVSGGTAGFSATITIPVAQNLWAIGEVNKPIARSVDVLLCANSGAPNAGPPGRYIRNTDHEVYLPDNGAPCVMLSDVSQLQLEKRSDGANPWTAIIVMRERRS